MTRAIGQQKEKDQVLSKIIDLVSQKQNSNEELNISEMQNLIKDKELIERIKDMKNKQKLIEKRIMKKYEFKSDESNTNTNIKDESNNEENEDNEEYEENEDEENEENEEEFINDSNFNMNINMYFPIRPGLKSAREKQIERRVEKFRKKLEKELKDTKSKEEEKEKIRKKAYERETDEDKKKELELINNQEKTNSENLIEELERTNEQKVKEFEERLKKKI